MRKILVTAISGNVANGILKILRNTDDMIYGCDINDYAVGMDKVIEYIKIVPAVHENYIHDLILICEKYDITHLIPVNEKEIEIIENNKEKFAKIGTVPIMQDKRITDIFLDKKNTVDALERIDGISVPKIYLFDELIFDGRKYIAKKKQSCGSKGILIFSDIMQYEKNKIDDSYIIQEYIDGEDSEYTVGVFSDGIEINTIIFRRKLEHGYSSFVELIYDEDIRKAAEIIVSRFKIRGYINIQLRKDKGKNYIFEINPRISGTVYFRHMLGFEDVLWWLDMCDGIKIPKYKCPYQKAIGLRELNEKFVIMEQAD